MRHESRRTANIEYKCDAKLIDMQAQETTCPRLRSLSVLNMVYKHERHIKRQTQKRKVIPREDSTIQRD